MVDLRDLRNALYASALRVTAVEERFIINSLSDAEKRLDDFAVEEAVNKEAREPYEFI